MIETVKEAIPVVGGVLIIALAIAAFWYWKEYDLYHSENHEEY